MTTVTLFEGSLSDATTTLTLVAQRDLDNEATPLAVIVDGLTLGLSLDDAARLARAGERIEKALFKAKETPKESSTVFAYKIGFTDGATAPFEIAIVADPLGVSFAWAAKRLALGLGSIADLLFALSQIGSAVDAMRRVPTPAFDDVRGSRPFQPPPPPPPGERWKSWRPRCWDDVGGPGW